MGARPATGDGWRSLNRPARPAGPGAAGGGGARNSMSASPFSRLAVAHALSVAGDTIVTVALAGTLFFDISPTAARGRVALSLLLTIAPFAVVAPFLGPTIDRSRAGRRAMVIVSCGGRALACLAMAAVVDNLLLFPAAFVTLVLSKSHAVAKSSLVPTTVSADNELVEANSKLAISGAVMGFVAGVPAGLVLWLGGAPWVLRLGAVVFVAGAVMATRIAPGRGPTPDANVAAARDAAEAAELRAAGVILAAGAAAALRATVGFLTFLVAFAFRRDAAPSWWYGIVLAASTAGSLLGAAVAPKLRSVMREELILTGALSSIAVAAIAGASLDNRAGMALVAGVVGVAANGGRLAFESIVQRDAPDAVRGRSFARFEAGFQLVWVVGALIPVALVIPVPVGLFVLAAATGIGGLAYFAGRRRAHG